ncbi:MAG: insulinase family protein [Ruminococcaceae bacterium]|nr:insulinase family protein [Oscillospiraceae bacterium]
MNFTKYTNELLKESYYKGKHKSGLEVIVIPKDQMTLYATFATRYGSMDNTFKTGSDSEYITVPDGIAHFLEHKLFESDDGTDTFSRFTALGASANAYTSNEVTSYLFSATENYYESLEVLLDFVTHPYFSKENVDKEMGIIEQELRMYEDNPYRWMYQELLRGLYQKNTVNIPVGGTVESIHEITPEILYDCYNTFYNLNNMVLIVCGNVSLDGVEAVMDKALKESCGIAIEKKIADEPRAVAREYTEKKFPVALPVFNIGLKETDIGGDGRAFIKREFEHMIIAELIFGKTSQFYNTLYSEGLINQKFGTAYYSSASWGFFIASGESRDPISVRDRIKEEIELWRAGKKEISSDDFERAKRVLYSASVQAWNSTSDIAEGFLDYYLAGADMLDLPEVLSGIGIEDIKKRLEVSYDTSLVSMTVAKPEDKEGE